MQNTSSLQKATNNSKPNHQKEEKKTHQAACHCHQNYLFTFFIINPQQPKKSSCVELIDHIHMAAMMLGVWSSSVVLLCSGLQVLHFFKPGGETHLMESNVNVSEEAVGCQCWLLSNGRKMVTKDVVFPWNMARCLSRFSNMFSFPTSPWLAMMHNIDCKSAVLHFLTLR